MIQWSQCIKIFSSSSSSTFFPSSPVGHSHQSDSNLPDWHPVASGNLCCYRWWVGEALSWNEIVWPWVTGPYTWVCKWMKARMGVGRTRTHLFKSLRFLEGWASPLWMSTSLIQTSGCSVTNILLQFLQAACSFGWIHGAIIFTYGQTELFEYLLKVLCEARKMTLWLENMPHKHEDQGSDPHSPQKRPRIRYSRFKS